MNANPVRVCVWLPKAPLGLFFFAGFGSFFAFFVACDRSTSRIVMAVDSPLRALRDNSKCKARHIKGFFFSWGGEWVVTGVEAAMLRRIVKSGWCVWWVM